MSDYEDASKLAEPIPKIEGHITAQRLSDSFGVLSPHAVGPGPTLPVDNLSIAPRAVSVVGCFGQIEVAPIKSSNAALPSVMPQEAEVAPSIKRGGTPEFGLLTRGAIPAHVDT